MGTIITLLITIIIVSFLVGLISKGIPNLHSNWNTLIDGMNYSTRDFYNRLEDELKSHGIENIYFYEKAHREGNMTTRKRKYMRVQYKEYYYDCCCAPFGNGTFISWWLIYQQDTFEIILTKIPRIGNWLARKLYPITYYKIDTASMFMTYAQNSVLKVIDDITKEKGIRSIPKDERKPILQDVFKR